VESQKFDALTRQFGAGATRRSVVKQVSGGLLGLAALAGLQRGVSAGAPGTCPNGKSSSCPPGCLCDANKTCFTCPSGSQPTVTGGCRCTQRPSKCKQRFGSKNKNVARIECAG
jgi:hypothetical protein